MLAAIEETALGQWVATSLWGYPIVLSMHAVGMALLVGVSFVICARAFGFAGEARLGDVMTSMRYAWAGLVLNAGSGAALFAGRATKHGVNPAFLLKLVFIIAALVALALLLRRVKGLEVADGRVKFAAAATAGLWVAALIAGRLIGYVQEGA